MGRNGNNFCSLLGTATIMLVIVLTISIPTMNFDFSVLEVYGQKNIDSDDIIARGGGTGSISCPDGSSKQAVIAFVVFGNGSSAKISTTNWNINELPSGQSPNPGFASGSFNSINVSTGKFQIIGQKINEVQFCEPPLSLPVMISGSCGQNILINVEFQSNNPLLVAGGTFRGDVTCSQASAGST
jgi:hypothetical protein